MKRTSITVWKLMPSFRLKEVRIVSDKFDRYERRWFVCDKGARHMGDDLHESKAAAIRDGEARLREQQSHIDELTAKLQKKRANLDRARD